MTQYRIHYEQKVDQSSEQEDPSRHIIEGNERNQWDCPYHSILLQSDSVEHSLEVEMRLG